MTEKFEENALRAGVVVSYLVVRLGANKVEVVRIFESEDKAHEQAVALAKKHQEGHYAVLPAYFVPLGAVTP